MYYKCVKFHKNPISRLGGVALKRCMDGWTDGRMDGRTDRVIPIYPPKLCLQGGIKKNFKLTLDLLFSTFLKLVHVQINCIFFDNTLYIYNIYATEALQHMKHKRKYVSVI